MMLKPRSTVCAIACAFTVANFAAVVGTSAPARYAPRECCASDPYVRAVEPRAGSPLKIELGGDPSKPRAVTVKIRDPFGRPVPYTFPPPSPTPGTGPIQVVGPILDREYRGFTIEVVVTDAVTGSTIASSSSTIG
jgi:hypothetical protein